MRRARPLLRSDSIADRRSGRLRIACLTSLALSLHGIAHAQAQVPNAGQSLRDVETLRPTLPVPAAPDLAMPPSDEAPSSATAEGPRIPVSAFAIEGNAAIPAARLDALLVDLVGRELSFGDLQQAAARITAYYREHGYVLARAYLPHQDIEHGVVRIAVVEGRYGQLELHNRTRVLDRALRQPLASLQPGEIVSGNRLERSLMLLNEMPGVDAKGTLRPGAEPGTTDLVIDAERSRFATGSVEFDNFGDPLTGRYRATGSIDVNAPLRLGDRFSLRGLTSNTNQRYYRASYQVPVGPASTRVGIAYSDMNYRIGGSLKELRYHGGADVRSAFVTQPLLRSRRTSVDAQVTYENKHLRDVYSIFDVVGDKTVDLWSFGVSGNRQDGFGGGGRTGFSATVGIGHLSSNDPLDMNYYAHTLGQFAKLNINALRLQALGSRFQLYTQFSAQLSSRNLDSSEKFNLGGPYGVRAFALGAGSGDQGWQATAELRYLVAPGWQLSTFADTGRIQLSKQRWSRERNTVQLSSLGIGASWYGSRHQVSVTAALPVGYTDQVASPTRSPSVWLQAAQYF